MRCLILFLFFVETIFGFIGFDFSPDSKMVVLCIAERISQNEQISKLVLINLENNEKEIIEMKDKLLSAVAWSPKGDKIAFIYNLERIGIYNLKTKKFIFFDTELTNFVFPFLIPKIKWNLKGDKILVNCSTTYNPVKLLNCVVFDEEKEFIDIESVNTIDFKVSLIGWDWIDERVVYIKKEDGTIFISDIEGKEKKVLGRIKDAKYIAVSPDGDKIAVQSPDFYGKKTYIFKNVRRCIKGKSKVRLEEIPIYLGDWFPDSMKMLTCEKDGEMLNFFIYNFASHKIERIFSKKLKGEYTEYRLSPDGGKILIIIHDIPEVYIYKIEQNVLYRIF